jgi:hypothetical protein
VPQFQEQEPTPRYGLEAFEAAMQDPSVPIFHRSWRGRLQPLGREEAAARAVRGDLDSLYCELPGES